MDRRRFLLLAAGVGAGATVWGVRLLDDGSSPAVGPSGSGSDRTTTSAVRTGTYGELRPADRNGIQLPEGFSSRVLATGGSVVESTSYVWHPAPDGGACFEDESTGGWVYVSNSEAVFGGAGALRFAADGNVADAYRILSGTVANCAGGATPWGTWLSCEEHDGGQVWECDPFGRKKAVVRPALGTFRHEAAACDPVGKHVYLTEDAPSGKLRRFRPDTWGDLSSGSLEAAVVDGTTVTWTPIIEDGTPFDGGEGLWYADGSVWFTTKGDNRVWELDVAVTANTLRVPYDASTSPNPVLTGVDNVVGSTSGDLFVAEDGGNMELVRIDESGAVSPFLRILGQDGSEITGPAFSPDGTRLYVSSQRGPTPGGAGVTYEVRGPFSRS